MNLLIDRRQLAFKRGTHFCITAKLLKLGYLICESQELVVNDNTACITAPATPGLLTI